MIPLLSLRPSTLSPSLFFTRSPLLSFAPLPRFKSPPHRNHRFPVYSAAPDNLPSTNQNLPSQQQQQREPPRTLFPGGYKRAEIEVPTIVLQLDTDDIIQNDTASLDFIDKAVSKHVRIVVLNGGSGKRLYEAACLLKSVVKDRAYLLIGERVDIASAVSAGGVVLSDQGLPAIVARDMMGSKSESVILPLVGRNVQTPIAAINASNSEGADFLIYSPGKEKDLGIDMNLGLESVKIPVFVVYTSRGEALPFMEASEFLKSGASGLVMSIEDLRMFSEDALDQLFSTVRGMAKRSQGELQIPNNAKLVDVETDSQNNRTVAGFVKLEGRKKQLIETEKSVLLEAINTIQKATPLMKEVSLLVAAVSQIDEPFLLAIVGEFNSGKSTVINALLGKRYLKEGVIPTTNEITFLRYSKYNDAVEQQRCERHPDGQYICYLPAPILKEMNIVDTPGTNVILQRQQRLTEEFVPRADLLLFVISADRPLTESEVSFLRYTQQWKKKVVFVLNKSDLYGNSSELEEAVSFIKENTRKLLNAEDVTLYPVSARSALEAKLSACSGLRKDYTELSVPEYHEKISRFYEFEKFLYSFLDGSTRTGMERMMLKLETPVGIAERLLSSCETLVKQDCQFARQDLVSATEIIDSVKDYSIKMENESISWRRKTISLIDMTKSRILKLIESTLQLSNIDLVVSYTFQRERSAMSATTKIQNDIVGPALLDAQKILGEYMLWLRSNNANEAKQYKEYFEKRLPSFINPNSQMHLETHGLVKRVDQSLTVLENFSAGAASTLFEQEIREVFLGTFGGLGAAGLSASLLTSVLPTTLEDLLALGLCSAGGFVAISTFPARRQEMINKVNRVADGFAREVEEAMEKDLLETVGNLEDFVKYIGKPYQDSAQKRLDELLGLEDELLNVEKKLRTLRVEIQNLLVS